MVNHAAETEAPGPALRRNRRRAMAAVVFALCPACVFPAFAVIPGREAPVPVRDTYNPRPDANDILLPMPCDLEMALRKVVVPGGAAFYIGKYEVSGYQWNAVMTGECGALSAGAGALPLRERPPSEVREFLTRYNAWLAKAFRDASGLFAGGADGAVQARLPGAEEWEFAARGGLAVSDEERGRDIPQDKLREYGVISDPTPIQGPERIGSLKPNPLGLYDTVGNVKEMVAASSDAAIAFKGGSFRHTPGEVRLDGQDEITSRNERGEERRVRDLGFRVAVSGAGYEGVAARRALRPGTATAGGSGAAWPLAAVVAALAFLMGGVLSGALVLFFLRRRFKTEMGVAEKRAGDAEAAQAETLKKTADYKKRLAHAVKNKLHSLQQALEAQRKKAEEQEQARQAAEARAAAAEAALEQARQQAKAWAQAAEAALEQARRQAEERAQVAEAKARRIGERATAIQREVERVTTAASYPAILDWTVEKLGLPAPRVACLKKADILYVGQFLDKTDEELLRIKNFGKRSLGNIKSILNKHGITIGQTCIPWVNPEERFRILQEELATLITKMKETEQTLETIEEGIWRTSLETFTNSLGIEFVLIPAGSFMMGSPEGVGEVDERPQHRVTITRPFYLGKFPVTQAQWQAVMGNNPSKFKGHDHPVEMVSWYDTQEFIKKLNTNEGIKRYYLPTEAEWEYACRAGTETRYYFGNDDHQLGRYAWYGENSGGETHPVGQKQPNAWGLYDILGNVWEWCANRHGKYKKGTATDPQGAASGSYRVIRGGGYSHYASYCRSATRMYGHISDNYTFTGFRLALSLEEPAPRSRPKASRVRPKFTPYGTKKRRFVAVPKRTFLSDYPYFLYPTIRRIT